MFDRLIAFSVLAIALSLSACIPGTSTVNVEATVQSRFETRAKETSIAQTQITVEALATSLAATQTALLPTRSPTVVPPTISTIPFTQPPQVVTVIITATPLPPTATPSPVPTRTVPLATSTPSSAPILIAPKDRSSFSSKETVTLSWTWIRPLAEDEFFEIQLGDFRTTVVQDWGCTKENKNTFLFPPKDQGYYNWRIVVRKGIIDREGCHSQGDVSLPSVIWGFDWRGEIETKPPVPKPYP